MSFEKDIVSLENALWNLEIGDLSFSRCREESEIHEMNLSFDNIESDEIASKEIMDLSFS